MIFIDGVGIGEKDFEFNPFFKYGFKIFDDIFKETPHKQNSTLQIRIPFLNRREIAKFFRV